LNGQSLSGCALPSTLPSRSSGTSARDYRVALEQAEAQVSATQAGVRM